MRGLSRQLAVVAAVAVNLVLNGLAGAGLLFGTPTGAVSDAVRTGITPAGWTFGVWSVIFGGLALFATWQARATARGDRYDSLGVPFVVGNLLTGLWQIPWLLGQFVVAAAGLFAIVGSVAWLYLRLDRLSLRGDERWALGVPVSLWLAWVTVAAALNVAVAGAAAGWAPEGALWPVAVIAAVAAVGAVLVGRTGDLAMALVLLWAFAGIAAAQADPATRAALAVAAVGVVGALWLARRGGASFWPTRHVAA